MEREKPSQFINLAEAIELLATDTRTNPTVDDKMLMRGLTYLRSNLRGAEINYTIHLVKRDENGKLVSNGKKFVQLHGSREVNEFEYACRDHYKALSGKEVTDEMIEGRLLLKQTTVVGDETGASGRPMTNTESKLKIGDELKTGTMTQTVE